MLFHSKEFLFCFFPITWLGFLCLVKRQYLRVALVWLTAASLVFYSWWNPSYLWLIISSISLNYCLGRLVRPTQNSETTKRLRILIAGISANLATLGYFKYANFFIDNINGVFHLNFNFDKVILPLAISFFTFQQIVFLVESFRGAIRDCGLLEYSFSVSFFPHLIAGPIVQYHELLPQIRRENWNPVSLLNLQTGLTLFILGLFKKMVLGDGSGEYVNAVFPALAHGAVFSFEDAWVGTLAYSFQIYFDFSGYSDMAIGLAKCFGIQLPINFDSPYRATSIIDFWRRWHITLSRFLQNYLYIPMGGGRRGIVIHYRNLVLTMLLGGLWHGAAWTFVIWGALHGFYLVINHAYRSWIVKYDVEKQSLCFLEVVGKLTKNIIYWGLTMSAVTIAWVFFRAPNMSAAISLLQSMFLFNPHHATVLDYTAGRYLYSNTKYAWLVFMLLIVLIAPSTRDYMIRYLSDLIGTKSHKPLFFQIVWTPSFANGFLLGLILFFIIRKYYIIQPSDFLYFNF